MTLTVGTRLGVYEGSAKVGEGGEGLSSGQIKLAEEIRRPVASTDESSAWNCT